MKIVRITYQELGTAYLCRHGEMELVALANVGPRVISLRFKGGANILFEDRENHLTRGQWRFLGGHRFWVGPETEYAFAPDNDPCAAEIRDEWLVLTQPADAMGLQKRLEIGPCPDSGGFLLRHVVENLGRLLYPGSIWTLTCALPNPVVVPWAAGSDRWQCNMVRYWVKWDNHGTDPAASQWRPTRDYFLLEPSGEEGKVGLYTERGFLALLRPESTFVKMHQPIVQAPYPDGGCNVELYTCSRFVELETLSPCMVYHPGQTYVHEERWLCLDKTFAPDQLPTLADQLPRSVTPAVR